MPVRRTFDGSTVRGFLLVWPVDSGMTWRELFDRAAESDTSVEDVRTALAEHRDGR